jgi:hypothetical protein
VQQTYFNPNGFQYKKNFPPIAVLAKNILEEKENQSTSQAIKRKLAEDKKNNTESISVQVLRWSMTTLQDN